MVPGGNRGLRIFSVLLLLLLLFVSCLYFYIQKMAPRERQRESERMTFRRLFIMYCLQMDRLLSAIYSSSSSSSSCCYEIIKNQKNKNATRYLFIILCISFSAQSSSFCDRETDYVVVHCDRAAAELKKSRTPIHCHALLFFFFFYLCIFYLNTF